MSNSTSFQIRQLVLQPSAQPLNEIRMYQPSQCYLVLCLSFSGTIVIRTFPSVVNPIETSLFATVLAARSNDSDVDVTRVSGIESVFTVIVRIVGS